jgi:hypothetical protein
MLTMRKVAFKQGVILGIKPEKRSRAPLLEWSNQSDIKQEGETRCQ